MKTATEIGNNGDETIPRHILVEAAGHNEPAMCVVVGQEPEAQIFFIFKNNVYLEYVDNDTISIDLSSPIAVIMFL